MSVFRALATFHGLTHSIFVFFNLELVQKQFQLLLFDIDSSHNIFVLGFRRSGEKFSKDVYPEVAPNEPHKMVAPQHLVPKIP